MYVHLLRYGGQVLDAVASFRPDVVVLDLVLPDRSGLELAEEIVLRYGEERPGADRDHRVLERNGPASGEGGGFPGVHRQADDPQTLLRRLAPCAPAGSRAGFR